MKYLNKATNISCRHLTTDTRHFFEFFFLLLNENMIFILDMKFFLFCGIDSSSSSSMTRVYVLSLITLVFVCSFSYCTSSSASSFGSSHRDLGINIDKNINDENNHYYRLPYRPSSSAVDSLTDDEYLKLTRNHLLKLLLKSALNQKQEDNEENDRLYRQNQDHIYNRRYAPQSFHAMRG